jgi:hypothetical protein
MFLTNELPGWIIFHLHSTRHVRSIWNEWTEAKLFEKLQIFLFQCQWTHTSLRATLPPARATNTLNLSFLL